MKIVQAIRSKNQAWNFLTPQQTLENPLVLVFGNRYLLEKNIYNEVQEFFPDAQIILSSSSGEIADSNVYDEAISLTAISFENSKFTIAKNNILNFDKDSFTAGKNLAATFNIHQLKHVMVFSEGSFVNGSKLIDGFESILPENITISGGLSGDDARFEKTLVGFNEDAKEGEIVALGLYGETLEVSFASASGWMPFGPERTVTKSKGNILYELDNSPALELYKTYLADKANELPQSALLYPLNVTVNNEEPIIRTILNIDEDSQTMILAGDIPEQSKSQLMMATVDNLVEGASKAAKMAMQNRTTVPQLAILVSCVGRKLVMDQRVEEEIEEVKHVVGKHTAICGYYSYGEIAPFHNKKICRLHNQTMTLTLISE
ncbi:FIST signal transduction protein [Zhouia sp. PK063]|uniref:FIST signal transduction protein n=1 Tax=Zhouia sp. PK063 TaxID=3373602 RepID=UPI00379357FD